jgi:glycine C-acetyltransferase
MKRNPTAFLKETYDELVQKNWDWRPKTLEGPSGPHVKVGGRDVIMFCSNNYLNLSNHPRLIKAAHAALDKYGAGSGSVRPIAGTMDIHLEVEKAVARFKGTENSLVYQTGFAANAGLIPQLADKGDLILTDELNHGSIIDGVRLTKADRGIYKHSDMGELDKALKDADPKYRRILIITDGVFSMDGDVANMPDIVKLANEYGAMTYVDDAHGEGVLGGGRGIGYHFNLHGKIDVEMGTFSKAFGVVGGLAAGSTDLRMFALNKSRTWLLSGSHPPQVAAAQLEAIRVLEEEPEHNKKLWENTNHFKKELASMGFNIGRSTTPITPVICGESEKAVALSDGLFQEGVYALPITFPMVARDAARIRNMSNAGHTKDDLAKTLAAYEKWGNKLGII